MIGPVDAVEARRLARSIVEARREGRRMKPLTNTRLLSPTDGLAIQDAMIDLVTAGGETVVGWSMIDPTTLAPVLSTSLIDGRFRKGIPPQTVDARVEPVLVVQGDVVHMGLRAIDKIMGIDLAEDEIAHGHGLVALTIGAELPSESAHGFTLRWGREQRELPGGIDGMRESVEALLAKRGRSGAGLITSAALMPSVSIERGGQVSVMVSTASASIETTLRHL